MTFRTRASLLACALRLWGAWLPLAAIAGPAQPPAECVVPARAGGGFALTCELVQATLGTLPAQPFHAAGPVHISTLPGGIGAVAFDRTVREYRAHTGRLVAFSSGSLLNLVQGKFGPHRTDAVRWLAVLGEDHGVLVVRDNAPWRHLRDLGADLQRGDGRVVFGAGGTIGSQDWIKAALVNRAAGADHKAMRFVSFEGGGDALAALQGGHVDVVTGDAAETLLAMRQGARIRVLAVLAPKRLIGPLAQAPTAREQGWALEWSTLRGVYMGPDVGEAAFKYWSDTLARTMAAPNYPAVLARHGLQARPLTGEALQQVVQQQMAHYRALAQDLGLRLARPEGVRRPDTMAP